MRYPALPRRQQGVSLFIALIALVAMTMAAISLVRSVDTGNQIAGNLAFKESATAAGDAGIEAARTWLIANSSSSTVDSNSPSNGYYATSQDSLDRLGTLTPGIQGDDVDWNGNGGAGYADNAFVMPNQINGNTIAYIINRLCDATGPKNTVNCMTYQSTASSSSGSTLAVGGYGSGALTSSGEVYYRVTVRIAGPRNTVSFVEAIILI